jgi:ASC-1-like (ASCH) protein
MIYLSYKEKNMKHYMKLQDDPFKKIKNKTKTIEMRLNDEKRKKIKQNDLIEFTNIKTKEKLLVRVVNLYHYENFEELYKNNNKISIGYLKEDVPNPSDMSIYYNQSDIKKYGTLAIEIRLAKGNEFFENSNL